MNLIPAATILVAEDRQRKHFDEAYIASLWDSIQRTGLINPIVVSGNKLVAGECRLRALKLGALLGKDYIYAGELIPAGKAVVKDFGELTQLEQLEIEYDENAERRDLTWQENVAAQESREELRRRIAAEKKLAYSIEDSVKGELKVPEPSPVQIQRFKENLSVARQLSDPDVSKAATLKEAKKIIKRKEETRRNVVLAQLTGKSSVSDRYKVYNVEAIKWLKEQPDGQFDVILTDPPYGMGAESFGDAAGRMSGIEHEYDDSSDASIQLISSCIPEWFRVSKPEAHLYIWCDIDHFLTIRELCRAAGWWTFRTPLINFKPEGGRVPWPEHGPRRSYELCLFAVKGKKPVTSIRPDYFESRLKEGNLGHGAQKPVEAYVELLKRSCKPGEIVLDSFAGTGTIFAAAAELNLFAVGTEQAEAAYGICLNRIKELK